MVPGGVPCPTRFIGIDGGGTRTRALFVDIERRIVRSACGEPTNPHTVGFEIAARNLRALLSGLNLEEKENLPVHSAFVAIAGLRSEADRQEFARAGVIESLCQRVEYSHDAHSAWAGALACEPGIVVLAGTGSKVYGFTREGRKVECGGFGFLLGDEGSAAWIGLRALRYVVRAALEKGLATTLTTTLLTHWDCNSVDDLPRRVYADRLTGHRFADLCPLVADTARHGDAQAIRIFQQAGRQLAKLAFRAAEHFPEGHPLTVSYQGGLFEFCGDLILEPFKQHLCKKDKRIKLEHPRFSGVEGSVLLAMRSAGVDDPVKLLGSLFSPADHG